MRKLLFVVLAFLALETQAQSNPTRFERLLNQIQNEYSNSQQVEEVMSLVTRLKAEQHIIVLSDSDYQEFHLPMKQDFERKVVEASTEKERAIWSERLDQLISSEISYSQFKSKYLK